MAGLAVVTTAMCKCSFGMAPSTLNVLPVNQLMFQGKPVASIMDHAPMLNIMPFGMCMSPANPTVIAATAAALGVFTPMPCIPNTVAPWIPGQVKAMVKGMPIVDQTSQLMCIWGGIIQTLMPGEFQMTLG